MFAKGIIYIIKHKVIILTKKSSFFFSAIFLLICIAIVLVGNQYKKYKINEYSSEKYNSLANSLNKEVSTLIQEKKNATLAVAISFSKSSELKNALLKDNKSISTVKEYAAQLKKETDFKNVWVHLVDKEGVSLFRNWTKKSGDNVSKFREDVRNMIRNPQVRSNISVGKFDMSFKSMVPIFDSDKKYIGFIEIITHFNSIAQKIKEKKFEPVVLVNKKYKSQIKKPFSNTFVGDNYVANLDADKKILELIASKGIHYFVSPYKNYIVDDETNTIVVNYTLFDISKEPMANFLMFKEIKDIDMSSVKSIQHTIELFIIVSVLLSAILFYILLYKESVKIQNNYKLNIFIFVALFLFFSTSYYFVVDWNFDQKRNEFFKLYNKNMQKDYQIIHSKYSAVAQTLYHSIIDKPSVLNILDKAYSKELKSKAREELYSLLIKDYEYFKSYDLKQLHFHLKNNESFLRFHRPEKYGDNLTGIRDTVEWVNSNQEKTEGFEEGRIFNGFRYVFPLFIKTNTNENKHIGSVETSFSAYAIATELAQIHKTRGSFIIKKDIVDSKVFSDEKCNYIKSPFDGFLYEKNIQNQFEHSFSQINIELLNSKAIQDASKKIEKGEVFSVQSDNKNVIFTFLPFRNPVSNEIVASMVLQQENYKLSSQNNLRLIFLLAGIIAILFVLLYIYKEFSLKHKFRLLSIKTQNILDAQTSMVVIIDNTKILDANKKLLKYFGYSSINEFKKEHLCICETFENDDRFFHLGKVPKGQSWIKTVQSLPYKEHIVAMKDINQNLNIFSIAISQFDDNVILSFNNISDTINEQFSLMDRVIHDKLTGAHNREYFDNRIDLWIQELSYQEYKLGIIMLDIDYFKNVNDKYGHNCGDEVLKHLVSIIESEIRQEDDLVRWGGEEFLIISKVNTLVNLHDIAENIRKKIEDETFEEVGKITCSFGATLYKDESIKATIERADEALYEAKKLGRNRVVSR
jgi:diguanylate cyclase (GGDEF)-like protein